MAATGGNTTRAKTAKLKKIVRLLVGYRCVWCGTNVDVQLAHVLPTEMSYHQKRSQWQRYNDAAKNPQCYRPMCRKHHALFDALTGDLMQAAKGVKEEPIPF